MRMFQDTFKDNGQSMEAWIAIKAAKNRNSLGRLNARRYCEKREVPMKLYRLACQLEAIDKAEKKGK